jgi:hypothetical protein
MHKEFWSESLKERGHWEDIGVDGGDNIRVDLKTNRVGSMDWIRLAQNRGQWRSVVNTVMNFRVL